MFNEVILPLSRRRFFATFAGKWGVIWLAPGIYAVLEHIATKFHRLSRYFRGQAFQGCHILGDRFYGCTADWKLFSNTHWAILSVHELWCSRKHVHSGWNDKKALFDTKVITISCLYGVIHYGSRKPETLITSVMNNIGHSTPLHSTYRVAYY